MRIGFENPECLVIGANGLIGASVVRVLDENGLSHWGTFHSRPAKGLHKLDITDASAVKDFFSRVFPKVIFHCANLGGGVGYCESNPVKAADFHLYALQRIGTISGEIGSTFVFISSDYIFDGTKESYREQDPPSPINLYGQLKFMAEEWIRSNVKKHIIIRTTNVFGWDPETATPNYVMNLYRTIKECRPFNAPSYLWGNPTYVWDLASAIVELYSNNANGVFHVVGSSFVNRFVWAKRACDILGLGKAFVKESKNPPSGMVPRPLRSMLNTDKFCSSYSTILHDVDEGLKLMKLAMQDSLNYLTKR